jgi:hypothetical protein
MQPARIKLHAKEHQCYSAGPRLTQMSGCVHTTHPQKGFECRWRLAVDTTGQCVWVHVGCSTSTHRLLVHAHCAGDDFDHACQEVLQVVTHLPELSSRGSVGGCLGAHEVAQQRTPLGQHVQIVHDTCRNAATRCMLCSCTMMHTVM